MNEELKIKVVLDQSDFKRQISTLKSSLKAAGETSKQTSTQGAQEATKSVGKTIAASLPVVGSLIKPGVKKIVKEVQNTLNGVDLLEPIKENTKRLFKPYLKHLAKQYLEALNELNYDKDDYGHSIGWNEDEAQARLDKAQEAYDIAVAKYHEFNVFAKDFEHSVNHIKNKIIEMGQTLKSTILPLIAVATALYKVTKATAELGNQIAINSQKFNMNTNEFQKWALYAEYCGSSMEELSEAFRQFSDKIYQAVNGASTAQEAFTRMNISLTDENGALKENSVLFNEVIDKLRNETNTTERSAKAQALFGDATQKLNLILNTEAGQIDRVERVQKALGAQMSGNLIAASNELKDSLTSLKQAFAGLRNSLGESLMPVVQKVVVWLTVLIAKVNILVRAIFGLKDSGPAYFGKAASGATAYAGAVGKATGALQKLKLQTMGFDEMNILEGPDDSGSSDVGTSIADSLSGLTDGGLMSSLLPDDALEKIEAFAEKVAAIKDQVQGYAFAISNIGGLLLIVVGLITGHPLMVVAGATLMGLSLNMGDGGGSDSLAAQLEDIASKVPAWVTTISLVAGILMVVVGLCTGNFVLVAAGAAMSLSSAGISGANGTWSWIANGIDGIMSKVPGWMAVGSLIVGLLMFIVGIGTGMLPLALAGATMAGFGFGSGLANGTWEWLVNKIKGVWESIKSWFSRVVAPVFTQQWWNTHLWNPVGEFFSNVFNKIKEKVSTLWAIVKLYWQQNISPIFTQQWWNSHLWQPIGDFFTSMGNKIRGKVSEVWTIVKLFWQQQIAPKFTATFWKNKFESIKLGARDAFNGLIGIVERGINLVVEKLNKLSFNIPDWVPAVGGNSFGISLKPVSIPRLATGGIATKSTLANIGEAGKEAILPLDSNTDWMDKLADRIVSRSNSTVVLEVDGRQLGKATVQSINNITKTTGRVPLVMA